MNERIGLYTIKNFNTEPGLGLGQYGPTIILAGEVVEELAGTKRSEEAPLFVRLNEKLEKSVAKGDRRIARLDFFQDSWLIQGIIIGKNCRCFTLNNNTKQAISSSNFRNIRYTSHNIDTTEQAAIIVSVWLEWFNNIIVTTSFDLPHSMV